MNAVFDTNIIIDALNGVADADAEYKRYERVLISRVTWMEVLVGAADDEAKVRDFLETQFEISPLDLGRRTRGHVAARASHPPARCDHLGNRANSRRGVGHAQHQRFSRGVGRHSRALSNSVGATLRGCPDWATT
jgi:PIN domain